MPVIRYEISADEAWTHTSPPLNRYWCFYGRIFGRESECDRLETALRAIAAARSLRGEVKWSSVTARNIETYKLLVDSFFYHVSHCDLKYRQAFLDRAFVHVPSAGTPTRTDLDIQFRICYQFLKHHFGLRYLAETDRRTDHHVTIRLDGHSSQRHCNELAKYVERLGKVLETPRLIIKVQFVNSKKFLRLQLCDLIMGAAGSHGNKMHLHRAPGHRGMTPKQKCRYDMATYVYDCVRALDASERGSGAFNWFETTGTDGHAENRLHHKLRIWKFIPKRYQVDEGWQNKNLDSQGRYLGQQINPQVHDRSGGQSS